MLLSLKGEKGHVFLAQFAGGMVRVCGSISFRDFLSFFSVSLGGSHGSLLRMLCCFAVLLFGISHCRGALIKGVVMREAFGGGAGGVSCPAEKVRKVQSPNTEAVVRGQIAILSSSMIRYPLNQLCTTRCVQPLLIRGGVWGEELDCFACLMKGSLHAR